MGESSGHRLSSFVQDGHGFQTAEPLSLLRLKFLESSLPKSLNPEPSRPDAPRPWTTSPQDLSATEPAQKPVNPGTLKPKHPDTRKSPSPPAALYHTSGAQNSRALSFCVWNPQCTKKPLKPQPKHHRKGPKLYGTQEPKSPYGSFRK